MGKKTKRVGEKSTRVNWKARVKILESYITRLTATLDDANVKLEAAVAEALAQNGRITELDSANADLRKELRRLNQDLWRSSLKETKLMGQISRLEEEVRRRRRVAGVLAMFHLEGRSFSDCHDEFARMATAVGFDGIEVPRDLVGEAYKSAGRKLHHLLFEHGIKIRQPEGGSLETGPGVHEILGDITEALRKAREAKEARSRSRRR